MKTIKNHLKRKHIKSRRWECRRCFMRFGVKFERNRHEEKVECEGDKPCPPYTEADERVIKHQEKIDKCKNIEEILNAIYSGDPKDGFILYDHMRGIDRLDLPDIHNQCLSHLSELRECNKAPSLGGINAGYTGMSALDPESVGLDNSPTITMSSPDSEESPITEPWTLGPGWGGFGSYGREGSSECLLGPLDPRSEEFGGYGREGSSERLLGPLDHGSEELENYGPEGPFEPLLGPLYSTKELN